MEKTEHVGYTDSSGMSRIQEDLRSRMTNDNKSSDMKKARLATTKSRKVSVGIVGAGFAEGRRGVGTGGFGTDDA